ncbi:MAG TPA: hypothetical protein VL125_15775 [Pelobium sp.]|nr:hypothetical protein [Pelobium sp.]
MEDKNKNIVSGPVADYEKAEMDLLRNAMKHSYTERFLMMTTLMKMDKMLRQAKVTHKPFPKSENN